MSRIPFRKLGIEEEGMDFKVLYQYIIVALNAVTAINHVAHTQGVYRSRMGSMKLVNTEH